MALQDFAWAADSAPLSRPIRAALSSKSGLSSQRSVLLMQMPVTARPKRDPVLLAVVAAASARFRARLTGDAPPPRFSIRRPDTSARPPDRATRRCPPGWTPGKPYSATRQGIGNGESWLATHTKPGREVIIERGNQDQSEDGTHQNTADGHHGHGQVGHDHRAQAPRRHSSHGRIP